METQQIILQNKYILLNQIGSGAYSKVYKGQHIDKKHYVAIKFDYDDTSKKLIENEICIYLKLLKYKDEHIVNIKSFGIIDKYNYIITEWVPYSFEEYIKKNMNHIDINKLFNNLFQIIETLHKRNFIHRDIKPDNFLMNQENKIYIIDLGLSTEYSEKNILKNRIGSYLFCSFNVHGENYTYQKKDDIISLFYMFFYLFTNGDLPWNHICMNYTHKKNKVFSLLKKYTNYYEYYKPYPQLSCIIKSYYHYIKNNKMIYYN